jgi:hypothetical protein
VRLAAVASATELFGAGSPQALRTAQAFDEVEIFDGAGSGPPVPLPPQEGEDSTLFVRRTRPRSRFLTPEAAHNPRPARTSFTT